MAFEVARAVVRCILWMASDYHDVEFLTHRITEAREWLRKLAILSNVRRHTAPVLIMNSGHTMYGDLDFINKVQEVLAQKY